MTGMHSACNSLSLFRIPGSLALLAICVTPYADISRDRCHSLNQSATRISGPDFTIMPAYSVVQQYAGLKLVSGPHRTVRVSTTQ